MEENLAYRIPSFTAKCPRYIGTKETNTHVLLECDYAQEVWKENGIHLAQLVKKATSWIDLCHLVCQEKKE